MPGFKDFVNLTALTETDLDDYLAKQVVMKFASAAARTTALATFYREGIVSYLDDLNMLGVNTGATDVHSSIGPVHGALASWTPTITQLGAVAATVTNAVYTRTGRWIQAHFYLSVTGTGTAGNDIVISGFPASAATGTDIVGRVSITDTSVVALYSGDAHLETVSTLKVHSGSGGSPIAWFGTAVMGAALASGDIVAGLLAYQAAAD